MSSQNEDEWGDANSENSEHEEFEAEDGSEEEEQSDDSWEDEDRSTHTEQTKNTKKLKERLRGLRNPVGRWDYGRPSPAGPTEPQTTAEETLQPLPETVEISFCIHYEADDQELSLSLPTRTKIAKLKDLLAPHLREQGLLTLFSEGRQVKPVLESQLAQILERYPGHSGEPLEHDGCLYFGIGANLFAFHQQTIDVIVEAAPTASHAQLYDQRCNKPCENLSLKIAANQGIRIIAFGVLPFSKELRKTVLFSAVHSRHQSVGFIDIRDASAQGSDRMVYLQDSLKVEAGEIVAVCLALSSTDEGDFCKTSNSQRNATGSDGALLSLFPADSLPITAIYYES